MVDTDLLNLVIGVVFVWFLLSVVVSAINGTIAIVRVRRGPLARLRPPVRQQPHPPQGRIRVSGAWRIPLAASTPPPAPQRAVVHDGHPRPRPRRTGRERPRAPPPGRAPRRAAGHDARAGARRVAHPHRPCAGRAARRGARPARRADPRPRPCCGRSVTTPAARPRVERAPAADRRDHQRRSWPSSAAGLEPAAAGGAGRGGDRGRPPITVGDVVELVKANPALAGRLRALGDRRHRWA